MFAFARSILLASSNYDAFEANETVSVCAMIMAEAIERTIIVQLTSQDSTATSKHIIACSLVGMLSSCYMFMHELFDFLHSICSMIITDR